MLIKIQPYKSLVSWQCKANYIDFVVVLASFMTVNIMYSFLLPWSWNDTLETNWKKKLDFDNKKGCGKHLSMPGKFHIY